MAYPRYSLLRYGIQPTTQGNDIPLYMNAAEKFNAVVGFATNADLSFIAGISLNGSVTLSAGHYEALEGDATLDSVVNAHTGISILQNMDSSIDADINWSRVYINNVSVNKDSVYMDVWKVDANSVLGGDIHLSTIAYIAESFSEVLSGHASTVNLSQQTFIANVTIPAHGRLIIDSNVFNMLLNGQNAIHLQKGDWIDIDRKTIYLDITSGTGGNLSGSIIYQERYL